MGIPWKAFSAVLLLISSEFFMGLECWSILLDDVIYEDIEKLNATCRGSDSCELPRTNDTLGEYNCNCGEFCSLLRTCCVDSKYRQKYAEPKNVICAHHKEENDEKDVSFYFPLISSCDPDLQNDKITEDLCNSTGEELNDPILKIHVTDPITGISYKNYYCYACNENNGQEEPIPWNLELRSWQPYPNVVVSSNLSFDNYADAWVMNYGSTNQVYVKLKLSLPEQLKTVLPNCIFQITSSCALDWPDDHISKQCLAYMALVRIPRVSSPIAEIHDYYRNPHCAICNNKSIEDMVCFGELGYASFDGFGIVIDFFVGLFYLDRERSECDDGMVYDHVGKKCRKVFKAKKRLKLKRV